MAHARRPRSASSQGTIGFAAAVPVAAIVFAGSVWLHELAFGRFIAVGERELKLVLLIAICFGCASALPVILVARRLGRRRSLWMYAGSGAAVGTLLCLAFLVLTSNMNPVSEWFWRDLMDRAEYLPMMALAGFAAGAVFGMIWRLPTDTSTDRVSAGPEIKMSHGD